MKRIYLSLITIISLVGSAQADRLVIKGSDTLGAKLVPQLAEQFKAQHPGTTFDIAAEGSTTGIAAIIDGTLKPIELTASGWREFDAMYTRSNKSYPLYRDGIAIGCAADEST